MNQYTSLLDIPWVDVIFSYIFPRLTLKDVLNVRLLSREYRKLANSYIATIKYLPILAEETRCLLRIEGDTESVTNDFVTCVLKNNKTVTHVDLSNTNLSHCSLHGLIYCKNIRQLQLRKCSWLTTDLLEVLIYHLQCLEFLDARICCQVELKRIADALVLMPWYKTV